MTFKYHDFTENHLFRNVLILRLQNNPNECEDEWFMMSARKLTLKSY